jgi:DNA-binding HxlR family transcriptional regulator
MTQPLSPEYVEFIRLIGDSWVLLIVTLLSSGEQRFCNLVENLPNVSRSVLTDKLKNLETQGLIQRRVTQDSPPKVIYTLSEKGRKLIPVIKNLSKSQQEMG